MLSIPLNINKGHLREVEEISKSIDQHLDLLLSTPCYSCAADMDYGFIFNNLRFEIFNEREGVVYNSSDEREIFEGQSGLYEMKISGSSKNLNTFASELKATIQRYEQRLKEIAVVMTYVREEKLIYINVKGVIDKTGDIYNYTTTLRVWK